eukprot:scaffold3541_cov183-Alexandrium_tamarense.AAC.1
MVCCPLCPWDLASVRRSGLGSLHDRTLTSHLPLPTAARSNHTPKTPSHAPKHYRQLLSFVTEKLRSVNTKSLVSVSIRRSRLSYIVVVASAHLQPTTPC